MRCQKPCRNADIAGPLSWILSPPLHHVHIHCPSMVSEGEFLLLFSLSSLSLPLHLSLIYTHLAPSSNMPHWVMIVELFTLSDHLVYFFLPPWCKDVVKRRKMDQGSGQPHGDHSVHQSCEKGLQQGQPSAVNGTLSHDITMSQRVLGERDTTLLTGCGF